MPAIRRILSLLLLLCAAALSARAATWTTIDVPGAPDTAVNGINNAGDMVGIYGDPNGYHGFLLSGGMFTTFDMPGAKQTNPVAINSSGQISGWYVSTDGNQHGFFFNGQSFTSIDFPGATDTLANGINDSGEIVGAYTDTIARHGFKWINGSFTTIDVGIKENTFIYGINNRGQVVGINENRHGEFRDFVLSADGQVRTFNFSYVPFAINDKRIVVGGWPPSGNLGFRFNLKTKRFTKMLFPGTNFTVCTGINDAGQIVGGYQDAQSNSHGFLWTK